MVCQQTLSALQILKRSSEADFLSLAEIFCVPFLKAEPLAHCSASRILLMSDKCVVLGLQSAMSGHRTRLRCTEARIQNPKKPCQDTACVFVALKSKRCLITLAGRSLQIRLSCSQYNCLYYCKLLAHAKTVSTGTLCGIRAAPTLFRLLLWLRNVCEALLGNA